MTEELNFGPMNGHAIGIILKEAVRRASVAIRNERMVFESTVKMSYSGTMDDVFTSADTKAQAIYTRAFGECFPLCGIIGEEDNLRLQPSGGCTAYFTVDPLDGTKAYVRRQSDGVSTMVALVLDDEVICAYIGDINTREVYGYRPGSDHVFRISELDTFEELKRESATILANSYVMLRDPLEKYSRHTQHLVKTTFEKYEVRGSSIGTWFARLWKGEVAALLLPPGKETPWDSTPVIGISLKLGYRFLHPSGEGWVQFDPVLPRETYDRVHDVLVIHEKDLSQIDLAKKEE